MILSNMVLIRLMSWFLNIRSRAITITRISTSSITVIPDRLFLHSSSVHLALTFSCSVSQVHCHCLHLISSFINQLLLYLSGEECGHGHDNEHDDQHHEQGIISFVPASSPSFFASFFRSSKASEASLSRSSARPPEPFLKFCDSSIPNRRYAGSPHRRPNDS